SSSSRMPQSQILNSSCGRQTRPMRRRSPVRRVLDGHCAVALGILLAAMTINPSATGAQQQKPGWQQEWEKLMVGAKKEGTLVVYGDAEGTHPDIMGAFASEFPELKI